MKHTVSEEFIREAHKDACQAWKTRIEQEFPSLFNTDIGKTAYITDCSYSAGIEGRNKGIRLGGTGSTTKMFGEDRIKATIVSEPYMRVVPGDGTLEEKFVNVLYEDTIHPVLLQFVQFE